MSGHTDDLAPLIRWFNYQNKNKNGSWISNKKEGVVVRGVCKNPNSSLGILWVLKCHDYKYYGGSIHMCMWLSYTSVTLFPHYFWPVCRVFLYITPFCISKVLVHGYTSIFHNNYIVWCGSGTFVLIHSFFLFNWPIY